MYLNISHAEAVDIVRMLSTRRRIVCGVVIKSSWRDFSSGRPARSARPRTQGVRGWQRRGTKRRL